MLSTSSPPEYPLTQLRVAPSGCLALRKQFGSLMPGGLVMVAQAGVGPSQALALMWAALCLVRGWARAPGVCCSRCLAGGVLGLRVRGCSLTGVTVGFQVASVGFWWHHASVGLPVWLVRWVGFRLGPLDGCARGRFVVRA